MGQQSMKAMKANPAGRVEAVDPKDIIKEFDNLCKEGKLVEAQAYLDSLRGLKKWHLSGE